MAINTEKFYKFLSSKLDIQDYTGVPCSNLKYLINKATNEGSYVPSYNEGDSLAYAVGSYVSHRNTAVMMQNSGLGNAVSPISSLSHITRVPIKLIIGYRGMPGTKDEPQHELMGEITTDLLDLLQIPYVILNSDEDYENLDISPDDSIAFLIPKGVLSEVKLNESRSYDPNLPTRESYIIGNILPEISPEDIIVTTTGFTSRTMYNIDDRDLNFYQVGSMGCAISIATSLAMNNENREVYLIDGDGAYLMRSSGYKLLGDSYFSGKLSNLHIHVLDNKAYESTGNQSISSRGISIEMANLRYLSGIDMRYSKINSGGDSSLDRPSIARIREIKDKFRGEL